MTQATQLRVGRRTMSLSNLQKVLYPRAGFTKGQIIDYYANIAPVMLPHLRDRSVTFKRFPDGVDQEFFFEKNCPRFRPPWMRTHTVWSERKGTATNYCVVNDLPSLVWAVNLAVLEFHPALARVRTPAHPTAIVFDLDPGRGADVRACAKVALLLRQMFEEFRLNSFPKTSGQKGLQLYLPLNGRTTFETTKTFAHAVAALLERSHPELVVSSMSKQLRDGKVFIDWSQNDPKKTTVCAYSLRAVDPPAVSTPLTWEEVERASRSRKSAVLRFTPEEVLHRVEQLGDLFAPVERLKQVLPELH